MIGRAGAAPVHPHPCPHPHPPPCPPFTLTATAVPPTPSSSQAHRARGRAAPDLAGCPERPRPSRPAGGGLAAEGGPPSVCSKRVEAARGRMRARLCGRAPPATGRPRGPRAGTEWESVWRHAWATRCAGVLDATPHTRGRVPARHAPSAVGECNGAWHAPARSASPRVLRPSRVQGRVARPCTRCKSGRARGGGRGVPASGRLARRHSQECGVGRHCSGQPDAQAGCGFCFGK